MKKNKKLSATQKEVLKNITECRDKNMRDQNEFIHQLGLAFYWALEDIYGKRFQMVPGDAQRTEDFLKQKVNYRELAGRISHLFASNGTCYELAQKHGVVDEYLSSMPLEQAKNEKN